MNVGLVGYSSLGKQVEHLINSLYPDAVVYYFDDIAFEANEPRSFPFADYINPAFSSWYFVVGLGYKHLQTKMRIICELNNKGYKLLSCIHPSCHVDDTAVIEDGVILFAGCNIGMNVVVQQGSLLYNGVIVAHDSLIQRSAFLAPGVVLAGHVTIGECSFIGARVAVANGLIIEKNCIIGIGTVITSNVDKNSSVIGYPQRILNNSLKLS